MRSVTYVFYCMVRSKTSPLVFLFALFMALGASKADQDEYNRNVVGLMSGSGAGTYSQFAWQLRDELEHDGVRVLPVLGVGSYKNVEDLLRLKNISLAIVQSDVLKYHFGNKSNKEKKKLGSNIKIVETLYNEEIHILARLDIKNIRDLGEEERIVNIGLPNSGTRVTSDRIFKELVTKGILKKQPTFEHESPRSALKKLLDDEIHAIVYVAGKPTPLIADIRGDDRNSVHLLSLDDKDLLSL